MTPKPPLMPLSEEAVDMPHRYSGPHHGPLRPIVFLQLLLLHSVVTHSYCCLPKTRSPTGRSRTVGGVSAKKSDALWHPHHQREDPAWKSLAASPNFAKTYRWKLSRILPYPAGGKDDRRPGVPQVERDLRGKMVTKNSDAQPHTLPQKW